MEPPPTPDLLWIDPPVGTCVLSGGPVVGREATVELVGTGDAAERVVLGWSAGASCWYAALETLLAWCEDAGVSPAQAGPFLVDGAPCRAAVHLVEAGETIPWDAFAERMEDFTDRATAEAPSPDRVAALPALAETWELGLQSAGPVRTPDGLAAMTVAVVVDAGGRPRAMTLLAEAAPEALAALVRTAAARPLGDVLTAARPGSLQVADAETARRLGAALRPAGVAVRAGGTPGANALLDDFLTEGLGGVPGALAPLFADVSDGELAAFLDAAEAFYAAAPWRRLHGDRFVAVQDLGDPGAPWRYVSVMGQLEDTPGLGLFTRWLDVCALVHGGPDAAIGAGAHLESVTRLPLAVLDPEEAGRLRALGARPDTDGEVPAVTRYADGDMAASALPLPLVTAILTGVREAVAARRAATITSIRATAEAGGVRLAFRYPASGGEALGDADGVRLTVAGQDDPDGYATALGAGDRLVVEGPASAGAFAVTRAVRRAFEAADRWGFVTAFLEGGVEVWNGRARATDPGPTLDHFAASTGVDLVLALQALPVEAERLSDPAPELHAWIEAA